MSISIPLKLQLLYLVFALGYNVVSYFMQITEGVGLAATSPVFGFVMVVLIVAPCTVTGFLKMLKVHAIYAMFVSVVFCLIGGTFPHVRAYLSGDISNYSSIWSLIAAAGINFSGWMREGKTSAPAWYEPSGKGAS